jgi:hypothetical protein
MGFLAIDFRRSHGAVVILKEFFAAGIGKQDGAVFASNRNPQARRNNGHIFLTRLHAPANFGPAGLGDDVGRNIRKGRARSKRHVHDRVRANLQAQSAPLHLQNHAVVLLIHIQNWIQRVPLTERARSQGQMKK